MRNLTYCTRIIVSVTVAFLAACGGSQPPIAASYSAFSSTSGAYNLLYSFKGGSLDGEAPSASLLNVDGTLYGTTWEGGHKDSSGKRLGTVFALTTSGAESVLHRFEGTHHGDGANPAANLIDVNGTLYGTTFNGGTGKIGWGTVFVMSSSGGEKLLYSFRGGAAGDGAAPRAGLLDVDGTFYGTTQYGGSMSACAGGCGTVYSVTANGNERVLHAFGDGSDDGRHTSAPLINVDGTLYGTTGGGGANGAGTVFTITTSGKESVLYSFKGYRDDGAGPQTLVNVNGTLYGTTIAGGTYDGGTVFSITKTGEETVLYNFGPDCEAFPAAGLIDVNGTLYGTTTAYNSCYGSVFSITLGGKETILHNFDGADGSNPLASLINVNGTLYGTTAEGGAHDDGTVFSSTP